MPIRLDEYDSYILGLGLHSRLELGQNIANAFVWGICSRNDLLQDSGSLSEYPIGILGVTGQSAALQGLVP